MEMTDEEKREVAFGSKLKVARSLVPISKKVSPKTTRYATPVETNKRSLNKKLMKPLWANPRTTSLIDIRTELMSDPTEADQQTAKRKRTEMSPAGGQAEESFKAIQLKTIMDKICLQDRTIECILHDTYNCKKVLKVATTRLLS